MATITRIDIEAIADLAVHCDLKKLNIAIEEARIFDLSKLFCDFWEDVVEIMDKVEANDPLDLPTDKEIELVDGGSFTNCKGKVLQQYGVKRIWAYYAYARYLMLNGFNDTPNGNVEKTNNFSLPKPLKEVKDFSDKYRTMGHDTYEGVNNFLCRNSEDFEGFDKSECEGCGCGNRDCGNTKAKGYGFKMKTISKWDA